MNRTVDTRLQRVLAAVAILMAAVLAFGALGANSADAKKKAKKTKVTLAVTTKNQAGLLKAKKLAVKVRSNKKTKVKVSVVQAGKSNRFKTRTVKFKKKGVKKITLPLTKTGRKALVACGAKTVLVKAKYKKGKRKATAKRKKKLARDATRCVRPIDYATVPLGDNPAACDFLDTTVCLQPFPNDYYTTADASTPTGKRLNLAPDSTPKNTGSSKPTNLEVGPINASDGFSPGNMIILKVPGLDTPAAFENSKLVPLQDISAYKNPDQAVVVIDAATGERQPIWAELDSNPTSVDPKYGPDGPDADNKDDLISPGGINANPGNTGPVNLLIRPAKNFEFGHRYIVAFRNLKDADNKSIEAPIGFKVYRDNLPTQQDIVEQRRPHMEQIIGDLNSKAGISKDGLYMAWDFTIASEKSVTGRATDIRDAAFKALGDNNLADRTIAGSSPDIVVTAYCDFGNTATAQCGNNQPFSGGYNKDNPPQAPIPNGTTTQRTVVGYIDNVPCYLNKEGCPPGAEFTFNADGSVKTNTGFTTTAPFRCLIPRTTTAGGTVHPGGTGIYGHGLLGTLNQINSTEDMANVTNSSWCAANFDGFSEPDIGVIAASLANMSNFHKTVDRMQQGFVNFMMIQRALIHPDGFADEEAFNMTYDGNTPLVTPGSAIDTTAGNATRGTYYGISQGGIMGGAVTALSPDVDRGILGVPGINYSTLLRRSVDSDEYFKLPKFGLYANYPDEASRPVLLSLMQLLWDRGEGNGFAHNLTDNPLKNTNEHEVLLQLANGDHQVSNFAAEVEARTIGAKRYAPTLLEERSWDMDYEAIPPIESYPSDTDESFMVYYDGGPVGYNCVANNDPVGCRGQGSGVTPLENVPPRPEWGFGGDPHGYPRFAADAKAHFGTFYDNGTIDECALPNGICTANGWDGVTGLP